MLHLLPKRPTASLDQAPASDLKSETLNLDRAAQLGLNRTHARTHARTDGQARRQPASPDNGQAERDARVQDRPTISEIVEKPCRLSARCYSHAADPEAFPAKRSLGAPPRRRPPRHASPPPPRLSALALSPTPPAPLAPASHRHLLPLFLPLPPHSVLVPGRLHPPTRSVASTHARPLASPHHTSPLARSPALPPPPRASRRASGIFVVVAVSTITYIAATISVVVEPARIVLHTLR
ncbi:hypothetical protein PANT_7c00063 [Moesziomyces antarcticus T-34]|uniref:Uncharacterized protein n=1 Tax=Pseudozyma antarctica (strain T-34) TaxID=1151754 RepID=M9LTW8_PSEA3|nr:hypothetical protein PANT_7c00063 [Moesziomyces antarcticus T-34]